MLFNVVRRRRGLRTGLLGRLGAAVRDDAALPRKRRRFRPGADPDSFDALEARALLTVFTVEGINSITAAQTSGGLNPSDANAAAGPNHLVSTVNSTISWYTKAGTLQNSKPLGFNIQVGSSVGSFFEAQSPTSLVIDPRVVYDEAAGRFVVTALDIPAGSPARLLVAVSNTGDPNGTWTTQAITAPGADYDQVAVDGNAIYITANVFNFSDQFLYTQVWILPKVVGAGGLYNGGTSTPSSYIPASIPGVPNVPYQPATIHGATTNNVGYLVGYVPNAASQAQVIRINDPIGTTTFTASAYTLGNIDDLSYQFLPTASQWGTSVDLDAGDRVVYKAVWRNDSLYAVTEIVPLTGPNAGVTTAYWFRVNTQTGVLAEQGEISGAEIGPGVSTFYPSVSVAGNNDVAFSFSASGTVISPGSYAVTRSPTDSPGGLRSIQTVAAGVAPFTSGAQNGVSRWGDYSSVVPDPSFNGIFWAFNQYSRPVNGQANQWGTRFGSFTIFGGSFGEGYSAGDANGDRLADFNLYAPGTGTYSTLLNNGGNTQYVAQYGAANRVPLMGDFNGDGRGDIVSYDPSTTTFHWSMAAPDGYYNFDTQGQAALTGISTSAKPFVGDFNGDFRSDVALYDSTTTTLHWQLTNNAGTGTTGTPYSEQFGNGNWVPFVADFNSDFRTDFAMYEAATSTLHWLWTNSTGTGSGGTQGSVQFGNSTLTPMVADMNGDRRADFAMWNPAAATLYWTLTNAAGTGTDYVQDSKQFGNGNYQVKLLDMNGDFMADLVEFDPSTTTFHWIITGTNSQFSRQFGNGTWTWFA